MSEATDLQSKLAALHAAADYVRRDLNMRAEMEAGRTGREPVVAIGNGAWIGLLKALDNTESEALARNIEMVRRGIEAAGKVARTLNARAVNRTLMSLDPAAIARGDQ